MTILPRKATEKSFSFKYSSLDSCVSWSWRRDFGSDFMYLLYFFFRWSFGVVSLLFAVLRSAFLRAKNSSLYSVGKHNWISPEFSHLFFVFFLRKAERLFFRLFFCSHFEFRYAKKCSVVIHYYFITFACISLIIICCSLANGKPSLCFTCSVFNLKLWRGFGVSRWNIGIPKNPQHSTQPESFPDDHGLDRYWTCFNAKKWSKSNVWSWIVTIQMQYTIRYCDRGQCRQLLATPSNSSSYYSSWEPTSRRTSNTFPLRSMYRMYIILHIYYIGYRLSYPISWKKKLKCTKTSNCPGELFSLANEIIFSAVIIFALFIRH